jgi:3-oxoacyl-[acyl-carrier-protein] synthase II
MGYHAIRQGRADFMVCAGAEAFGKNLDIFPTFFHAGMLSSRNAESGEGCRPGDARANGTVLGEASGAIVLESESSARSRGARVLGEVIGTGSSFDDGCVRKIHGRSARPVIVAMRNALAQARLEAASIGYINCFANGTPSVDGPESEAIGSVFGNRLPLCGAYKGITGEVSGSNDTLGSIQAVMTLEHGMAAPVAGLETPSRYCPIPYVLRNPSPIGSPFAMVNSFQVGGGVECLVIGKGEAR